jgi:hypothetical protein
MPCVSLWSTHTVLHVRSKFVLILFSAFQLYPTLLDDAIHRRSQYVTFIAFPLPHWLHERTLHVHRLYDVHFTLQNVLALLSCNYFLFMFDFTVFSSIRSVDRRALQYNSPKFSGHVSYLLLKVLFSGLNDKHPPDVPLALRHTPSLGRFNSREGSEKKIPSDNNL